MASLKFGFKKTINTNKRFVNPHFTKDENRIRENEDKKDYIHSIEGSTINGKIKDFSKSKDEELVIPMIKRNDWRGVKQLHNSSRNTISSKNKSREDRVLEKQAIQELLDDSSAANGSINEEQAIPLLFRNRIPDGYETDEKLDVSLRPTESTLDDYERVPIEQFGLAMLRGMGWKKEEGIGLKNKKVVDVKEAEVRPRGLGLGADRTSILPS